MTNNVWHQQGDVLLKPMNIPVEAKEMNTNSLIRSQVTGNEHAVRGAVKVLSHDNVLYLRAVEPFELTHSDPKEGHATLVIPSGEYLVDQPLEYDHFLEEARAVAD